MTPEALDERRKNLEAGVLLLRSQIADTEASLNVMRTNLSATTGALQECQYWIEQIRPPLKMVDKMERTP